MRLRVLSGMLIAMFLLSQMNADTRAESVDTKRIELSKVFEERGFKLGSPVFIRVYKKTSQLELWVEKASHYVLFKTYGICRWSGGLGPKHFEGDRQSPEGVYRITLSDLIVNPRWDRAMNINYPNAYDILNGRSGSGILIHGKCRSIGCFAIQDSNVEEVYAAVRAALQNGQSHVPVLALPFRFSSAGHGRVSTAPLNEFWGDLRRADLLFERDRLPPEAWICGGRYYFADRRGDSLRRTVHLPGCRPLNAPLLEKKPAPSLDIAKNFGTGRLRIDVSRKVPASHAKVRSLRRAACALKRRGCGAAGHSARRGDARKHILRSRRGRTAV
jgi:murein L,D-transpeptidase YafK